MSAKTGAKLLWITEETSELQVRGGRMISPVPTFSFRAAKVIRFADAPELTKTLYLTPSHFDHSSSKAFTLVD